MRQFHASSEALVDVEVMSLGNVDVELKVVRLLKGNLRQGLRLRVFVPIQTSCDDPRAEMRRVGCRGLLYIFRRDGVRRASAYLVPERIAILRRIGLLPRR